MKPSQVDLEEHYKMCESLVERWDRITLFENYFRTFEVTQGDETNNVRKAILARLEKMEFYEDNLNDGVSQ